MKDFKKFTLLEESETVTSTGVIPTSPFPEVQRRIDRAAELMQLQTEDEIFWLRLREAFKAEASERINSRDFKPETEELKIIKK